MTKIENATPRPWQLTDGSPRLQVPGHVFSQTGRLVAGCNGYSTNVIPATELLAENIANAVLIVRAVNQEPLLKEAVTLLKDWQAWSESRISLNQDRRTSAFLAKLEAEK